MKRHALALALAVALTAAPAGVQAHPVASGDDCRCAAIRETAGWCGHCEVGYLAGREVRSRMFVEAVDPRGHVVNVETLECGGCREAAPLNGQCAACGWGLVDGRLFASRLTYYLALGEPRATGSCGAVHAESWCPDCSTGRIGTLTYRDRATFDAARREHGRLLAALGRLEDCETCAVACYFGSTCTECGITYRDGEPSPKPGSPD